MKNNYVNISPYIASKLAESKDLKFYAVFLSFKALYSNSCIYNYSENSLAGKAGVSGAMVRHYIPLFLQYGYCRMHGNNLVFCKHEQLPDKRPNGKKALLIKMRLHGHTWRHYLSSIEAFLVRNAQRQQQFASAKGDKRKRSQSCENHLPMCFTVYQASKLFRCSIATASRKLRRLADEGWYTRLTGLNGTFSSRNPDDIKAMLDFPPIPGTYFTYKGRLYMAFKAVMFWNLYSVGDYVLGAKKVVVPFRGGRRGGA